MIYGLIKLKFIINTTFCPYKGCKTSHIYVRGSPVICKHTRLARESLIYNALHMEKAKFKTQF
jgi:hypothetical protein